ncbi:MAG: cytochrome c family protein [Pseudomonadota bacterium]|nr:cytochrome c family protein [Pseudomonadota bacterium]
MGDLFWNKVAGVLIGAVLAVMAITELGHLLVPSHGAHELTDENTSYPVDWAAIESGGGDAEPVEEGPTDYGLLLANADISNGERVARRCAACHTFEQGGANGVGPNLWGVVGADIATHAGFSYSAALQALEGEWTYEALNHFIESPASYAPGTAMSFRGLGDEAQRFDLIAYLHSLSDNPLPFPDPLPEEGEMAEEVSDMAEQAGEAMGDAGEAGGEESAAVETEGDAPVTAEEAPAGGEVSPSEDEEPQENGGH